MKERLAVVEEKVSDHATRIGVVEAHITNGARAFERVEGVIENLAHDLKRHMMREEGRTWKIMAWLIVSMGGGLIGMGVYLFRMGVEIH